MWGYERGDTYSVVDVDFRYMDCDVDKELVSFSCLYHVFLEWVLRNLDGNNMWILSFIYLRRS